MNINMIGIDHTLAGVNIREKVALTKSNVIRALNNIKNNYNLKGVVIISTCSRTEVWLSNYKDNVNIYKMICNVFSINEKEYKDYFITRSGEKAVYHLFELASGLKSKIIGEDQILTQVRESADIAREEKTIDSVLEKLFQIAVTAAKKVKTNVRINPFNNSAGERVVEIIKSIYKGREDINCLVIGNGEIGKVTAEALVNAGFNVYMTVRQYKKGEVVIPKKCKPIKYEDRLTYINLDVIVSGTLSPHYTLEFNSVKDYINNNQKVFIDLAMPRDIDPKIERINGILLYDIDDLGIDSKGEELKKSIYMAKNIIDRYIKDFKEYYYLRDIKRKMYHADCKSTACN